MSFFLNISLILFGSTLWLSAHPAAENVAEAAVEGQERHEWEDQPLEQKGGSHLEVFISKRAFDVLVVVRF